MDTGVVVWVVVIVSSIWVLIDARSIGVKRGLLPGMGNMGPLSWCLVTLLLWIIGFPMYLYYRGKFKAAVAGQGGAPAGGGDMRSGPPPVDNLAKLERLAALRQSGALTDAEFETKKKELL